MEDGEIDYDKDGYISVDELYEYVKKNVENDTKGKQVPTKKGKGKVNIARSIKVVKDRREEFEKLSERAKELLNEGRFDEAFDK